MPHSLKPVLLLALCAIAHLSTAQQAGYLKTSELLYYGVIHGLREPDPHGVVFEFNNGNRRTFTPQDAIEFGTQDERKWVSRELNGEHLFFEELVSGKAAVLYLDTENKKSFFLEKDGKILALEAGKDDQFYYRDVLLDELSDCYLTEKSIDLAKYKAANLKYFVSQYNDCLHKPFPKFRVGPAIGLRFYRNEIDSKFFPYGVPEEHISPSLGALVELPISYSPQILLVTQPTVAIYSFSTFTTFYNIQTAVTSNTTHHLEHIDLDLPLMLKYRMPYYKSSPFIQLGLAYQLGLTADSYAITDQYTLIDGQFTLTSEDVRTDSRALAKGYFGAIGGIGVEIPVNPYITSVVGANFSVFNAKIDTGSNRKTYPELYLAVTF